MRRKADLVESFLAEMGGREMCSVKEQVLVNIACALTVQLEEMEADFMRRGEAGLKKLLVYQRISNTLRRHLQTLGLERRPKDITATTLGQILQSEAAE